MLFLLSWAIITYGVLSSIFTVYLYTTVIRNKSPLIQDVAVPAILGAMTAPIVALSGPASIAPISVAAFMSVYSKIDPVKSLNNLILYSGLFFLTAIIMTIIIYNIFAKKDNFDVDGVPPIVKFLGLE